MGAERIQNPTGLLLCLNCVVVEKEEEKGEEVVEGEATVSKQVQQVLLVSIYESRSLK